MNVVDSLRLEIDRVAVTAGRRHADQLSQKYGATPPADLVAMSLLAFIAAADLALTDTTIVAPNDLRTTGDRLASNGEQLSEPIPAWRRTRPPYRPTGVRGANPESNEPGNTTSGRM